MRRALSDYVRQTHSEVFEFNVPNLRAVGFVALTPERLVYPKEGVVIHVPDTEEHGAIVFPITQPLPRAVFFLIDVAGLRRADPRWRMASIEDRELHASVVSRRR